MIRKRVVVVNRVGCLGDSHDASGDDDGGGGDDMTG